MSGVELVDLVRVYDGFRDQLNLPRLRPVRLTVAPRASIPMAQGADLLGLLGDYGAGWIAFRSGVDWFSPSRHLRQESFGLGPIMAAELAAGSASLHVSFDGDSGAGWRLVDFAEGEGDEFLAEDLIMLSETWTEAKLNLSYRRYWGLASDGAMRPIHARFAGFTEKEG